METWKLYRIGEGETLRYAADEFRKYLERMDDGARVEIESVAAPGTAEICANHAIWLGQMVDFGWEAPEGVEALDDAVRVEVEDGSGIITGANPRSVLLAVYRFLCEAGCRWVRPGADGEVIPRRKVGGLQARFAETASFRHRAICIEGATSLENVLELIEWMPKVGFSGYFMQFREGFTFFDRWQRHQNNPMLQPEEFTVEQARQFTSQIERELQRRGMVYQAIGHGWTCEAYGIPCLGWDPMEQDWPQEVLRDLAEVDAKRAMRWNVPSITALCYSRPEVQQRMAQCVVDYAASHRQIDLLHLWLDDGYNNKCECEQCRKRRPADYYIELLNRVDEGMSRLGLRTKVVFLAYVDMLWPPEMTHLNNPDRFIFMFAPISRTYQEALKPSGLLPDLPPFELNKLEFPKSIEMLLAFLNAWQEAVPVGDSFVYDYYMIFGAGMYGFDPGMLYLSRMIHEDIRLYPSLGLNGLVSCQVQRAFFPNGLAMYVMGRTLWQRELGYEALRNDYFQSAYGEDCGLAYEYFEALAKFPGWGWLLKQAADLPVLDLVSVQSQIDEAVRVIEDFKPVARRNAGLANASQAQSWKYLEAHLEMGRQMLALVGLKMSGQTEAAAQAWQDLKRFVCEREIELQPVLDVWLFVNALEAGN
jgi:hypothetical protein